MKTNVNVSFPWLGLLSLLFIGLKLTGHIAWSWLWVLAPMWLPAAIVLVAFCVLVVCHALVSGGR